MKTLLRTFVLCCVFAIFGHCSSAFAQTGDYKLIDKEILARLTTLRDAFVKQTVTEGFDCAIKPPVIVLKPVPSFGNYDDDDNTLTTPAWHQLSPEEKALFHRLAGPNADDDAARATFESGTYRWVFIHEMGHWWQACKHANVDRQHYQQEYEANRIAAAYWRQTDPAFLAQMNHRFEGLLKNFPNPLPAGADPERFFNDNYGEPLARTNAYPWFQAQMIGKVDAERPAATFAQALRETGK